MKQENKAVALDTKFDNINDLIIDAIRDIKGKKIVKLDLTKIEDASANYFIICEGDSTTQVSAIANNIKKRMKEDMNVNTPNIEGMGDSRWVLIDYFDTVVHVFYPETRKFYDLEDLWSDAYFVEYQDL